MSVADADWQLGFFDRQSTKTAIAELGACQQITIFVGSGASLDLGIASWGSLVDTLLKECIESRFSTGELIGTVSRAIVDLNFYIPTASIIDSLLEERVDATVTDTRQRESIMRDRRNDRIADILYQNESLSPFPQQPTLTGKLLDLVAILKVAQKDVHIVTTNYDTSFEKAELADPWNTRLRNDDIRLKSFSTPPEASQIGGGEIPIVHLHGTLESPGLHLGSGRGSIVFSEADYISWEQSDFPDYLINRCGSGGLLTVGASLRDANIVSRLHRATKARHAPRYALMPMEGDYVALSKAGIARKYWPDISALASKRGGLFKTKILRPDFYGQVFQFIQEVGLSALSNGSSTYVEYSRRIRQWASDWVEFREVDAASRSAIEDAARAIARQFEAIDSVDHCKIEVWARTEPDSRRIQRWCSSQSTWRADAWPHSDVIEPLSDRPAVRCFCERSRLLLDAPFADGRWTHYMAVPVFLTDEPWADIPVGSVLAFFHCTEASRQSKLALMELNEHKGRWFDQLGSFGLKALGFDTF